MPTKVRIGETDLLWLYQNHDKTTYHEQAERIGCCVDTLKRILVREGLQEFDGAKYQVRRIRCGHDHVWIVATKLNARRTITSASHVEKLEGMTIEKA